MTQMCMYFKTRTDVAENLIDKFFSNFDFQRTFSCLLEYRFLVESTKIENASFSYTAAIWKADVKMDRMVSAKWIYHKERTFASNYIFFFLKTFTSV